MKSYDVGDGFFMDVENEDDEYYRSYLRKEVWGREPLYEFPKFSVSYEEFLEWSKQMIETCKEVAEKDREFDAIKREWEEHNNG